MYIRNPYYNCQYPYSENIYRSYPDPYYLTSPFYSLDLPNQFTGQYIPFTDEIEYASRSDFSRSTDTDNSVELKDYGPEPFVVDINEITKENTNYRTALWTGDHLQITLMSLKVGEDIGLEIHPDLDQFIRIEQGEGIVQMGDEENKLDYERKVYDDFAFVIPAGKWHNLTNTGSEPLKLYSIYAPPQHPHSTVHRTREIAQAAEDNHHRNYYY